MNIAHIFWTTQERDRWLRRSHFAPRVKLTYPDHVIHMGEDVLIHLLVADGTMWQRVQGLEFQMVHYHSDLPTVLRMQIESRIR
jgi:hypothetical protein